MKVPKDISKLIDKKELVEGVLEFIGSNNAS